MSAIASSSMSGKSLSTSQEEKTDKAKASSNSDAKTESNKKTQSNGRKFIRITPEDLGLEGLDTASRMGKRWITLRTATVKTIEFVNGLIKTKTASVWINVISDVKFEIAKYHSVDLAWPKNGEAYAGDQELAEALSKTFLGRIFQALKNKGCITDFSFDFKTRNAYFLQV